MNIFCVDHLPREIPVGYQTEHGVERVGFDVSTWIRKWPGMGFQLWASVPGTDTSYPAKSTREGNILFWDVGLADTAVAGRGVVEVVGLADGVKKIARADTLVRASTTAAFALDELGWWQGKVYKSLMHGNCWTPTQEPGQWEEVVT